MANQCCDRRHWRVKTCISILLKLKLNEAKCIIIHKYANNPTLQTGDKCFTCFVFLSSGCLLTQLKLCLGRTVTTTPIITEELPLGHYCNNNPSHSLLCCRSPLSHHTTSSLCTKKKEKNPHNCKTALFTESASHKGAVNQSSLMLWVWIPRRFLTCLKMQTGETPYSLRTVCAPSFRSLIFYISKMLSGTTLRARFSGC